MKSTQIITSLAVAQHFSKRKGESSFTEPDDTLDFYIDFMRELSDDIINDIELQELCENVFERKLTSSATSTEDRNPSKVREDAQQETSSEGEGRRGDTGQQTEKGDSQT